MFRAIGVVIVLIALSKLFTGAYVALDRALVATFVAIEAAAITTQSQLER